MLAVDLHIFIRIGSRAARVGKSCIISQFLYDKFLSRYRETVEELHRGEYELQDGASLTLDILDTSGAFQFPAMRALSISTGNAFVLVYSIDDAETWEEVRRLRDQVSTYKLTHVSLISSCRFLHFLNEVAEDHVLLRLDAATFRRSVMPACSAFFWGKVWPCKLWNPIFP